MHDLIINDLLHMKVYNWIDQRIINDLYEISICIVFTLVIKKDLKVLLSKNCMI